MLTKLNISLALATLVALAAALWLIPSSTPQAVPSLDKNLVHSIDDCTAIADKSVAHMVAIVDFQKLEIAGRRVRVLRNCMQDMGYQEDPQWTKFATPLAEQQAKSQHTSIDEAIEHLRREHMARIRLQANSPTYWKKIQKA